MLGADAIGINFYKPSPRWVDNATAQAILRTLAPFTEPVGVFVNQPLRSVFETLNQLGRIRTIQWHGENREVTNCYPFQMVAGYSVSEERHLDEIHRYLDVCRGLDMLPSAVLVDARVPGQYGGTGRVAPWRLLADFRPGVPVILAGGLTADNVAEAVRVVRPFAVDVASGVEGNPGRKDSEKLRRFIDCAREAASRYLTSDNGPVVDKLNG
jgi:phosphoribosylanthranilate isomerase